MEDQERRRRGEEAFERRVDRRVTALNNSYDIYFSEADNTGSGNRAKKGLPPTHYDRLSFFRRITCETNARNHDIDRGFAKALGHFWVLEVTFKLELAIMNSNSDPRVGENLRNDYMYERSTSLLDSTIQLPDMLFVCDGCGMGRECRHPPMPWPNIYIHRVTAHGDVSAFKDKACLNPQASVWQPGAGPDGLAHRVLKAIELGVGTTIGRLNLLVSSGELQCACGNLEERSWAGLVRIHLLCYCSWYTTQQKTAPAPSDVPLRPERAAG
ncbi:hypothetical protein C8Q78DRAFT_550284 [Trametes maxima]|nr:hypothetical protein C8Q78DRAFT_550284 [Trametes maxima]